MPEVADVTLGAKYQNELTEAMGNEYMKSLTFYLKVINQDGYPPGTEPPKGKDEELIAGSQLFVQLIQRAQMGDTLTEREQKFLMRQMELRRNGHADRQA